MLRILDRAVEALLGLLAVALIGTAFGQVVARYAFARAFSWVLELDVLLLVWATMLCGYVGVRRNLHMAVELLVERLAAPWRRRAAVLSRLLCIVFVAVFGWKSFQVIDSMDGIGFAALPIGQPWLYWSLPVGAGLMLVALVAALLEARE